MITRVLVLASSALAATSLAGCHTPGGGFMPSTGASTTYYSTEMMQKTVSVIDLRNHRVIFQVDVPVGKQLVIDFDKDEGDDPANTPDLMKFEIMELGTKTGSLHNSMTVPNAVSRRVDVTIRQGSGYAKQASQRPPRTDELADRPDWWTPEGGPLPEDKAMGMYDN